MRAKNFLEEDENMILQRVRSLVFYAHPISFGKDDVRSCLLEEFPEVVLLDSKTRDDLVDLIWEDLVDG